MTTAPTLISIRRFYSAIRALALVVDQLRHEMRLRREALDIAAVPLDESARAADVRLEHPDPIRLGLDQVHVARDPSAIRRRRIRDEQRRRDLAVAVAHPPRRVLAR